MIENGNAIESNTYTIDYDEYDNSKVTYQDLIWKYTKMCRTIHHEQTECISAMNGVIK